MGLLQSVITNNIDVNVRNNLWIKIVTLDQLRVFLKVGQLQHVTGAARAMNKTQSAVSAAVAALERAHGVKLFDRIGRDISLTSDGKQFLAIAKRVVDEADHAERMLADLSGMPSGPLRVVASQTVATYWLPQIIARFHLAHPDVDISLTTHNSTGAAEAVRQAEADLGVVEGRVTGSDLNTLVVAQDQLVVVVGHSHPWARKLTVQNSDLIEASWVIREQGSGTRAALEAELHTRNISFSDLNDVLLMPSNEACLAAVSSGQSATAVSIHSARPHLESEALCLVNITLAPRDFSAVTHKTRHQSRAAKAFLSLLQDASL